MKSVGRLSLSKFTASYALGVHINRITQCCRLLGSVNKLTAQARLNIRVTLGSPVVTVPISAPTIARPILNILSRYRNGLKSAQRGPRSTLLWQVRGTPDLLRRIDPADLISFWRRTCQAYYLTSILTDFWNTPWFTPTVRQTICHAFFRR